LRDDSGEIFIRMLDFHHKKITGVIPAERIIDAKESGGFYIRNPPRLFFF